MKLIDERPTETDIRLSLASHSYIYPLGIAEDVLVKVVENVYPVDIMILDIKENEKRPFVTMAKAASLGMEGKDKTSPGEGDGVRLMEEQNFKGRKAHLLEDKKIPSVGVFDEVSFYTLFRGRKAHLLEDKKILSVGVFDEVSFYTLFRENTLDLHSFGEETDKITDLHQIHEEVLSTEHGDDVVGIKQRLRDLSSDGVKDLAAASGRGRFKEDLE
uniref:Uncharacterized protein n=1 Tax=Tanacetum cinerariifolium TaxID=118510 RepID=A0A699HCC3_TANCI|nr:hypothetical protein [Tanacetum cinerariifolium]